MKALTGDSGFLVHFGHTNVQLNSLDMVGVNPLKAQLIGKNIY
jgi:hypothetical protein